MKYFYSSIVVLMIAYLDISLLFILTFFYPEYSWWFSIGALALWIISLAPFVIIIKKLTGVRDVWK